VRTKDTVIITSPQCAGKFRGDVRPLEPGQAVTVREVVVEGVAAYNRGKPFHPPSGGGLGFVITTGGRRIYFAGDTDLIPEMATVRADVALLPVSGTYVMSAEDAAEAVRRIRPAVTVPMHYGTIVGTRGDAIRFKELACRPVAILEKES
jgi:L-ascorbate metabolism protein UlaG (beta-lactamase superfamily)